MLYLLCFICNTLPAILYLQCFICNALYIMLYLLCFIRMHYLLCFICNALSFMLYLQFFFCNASSTVFYLKCFICYAINGSFFTQLFLAPRNLSVHNDATPLSYNGHPLDSLGLLRINPHYLDGNNIAGIDNILKLENSSNNNIKMGASLTLNRSGPPLKPPLSEIKYSDF